MKPVIFHPAAAEELQVAVDYYEQQLSGLGSGFIQELDRGIDRIREFPQIGVLYKNTKFRRLILGRYPYQIFYRKFAAAIWIVAVAHAKRRPGYWRDRSSDVAESGPAT